MASPSEPDQPSPPTGRRIGCWAALAALAVVVIGLAIVWANRERIADNVIADELAKRGISATYEVERIGGRRQVLRNIVVGDPARPDLTVEQAEVLVRYGFGFPRVDEVRLLRPRLYATYRGGALSFGTLDPLIFTGEKAPFEFPDMRLRVTDGRALLESDYGPVGFMLAGDGYLRGGFSGELAATAPRLAGGGCVADQATLYGRVSIAARRPAFEGPVRFASLACAEQGLAIADGAVQLEGRADERLTSVDGKIGLRTGRASLAGTRLASLSGDGRATWRDGGLTATYDLAGIDLVSPQAALARLGVEGSLRARRNFERIELESDIDGEGVRPGPELDRALADAAAATGETLLAPVLDRVRRQLAAEGRGSRLKAEATVRRTGDRLTVVVPQASWRGGSGATLLSLSRLQYATQGPAAPRFAGRFATGGEGLPRISGRLEQRPGGGGALSMRMAPYEAGGSRLAVPRLVVERRSDGVVGLAGRAVMSGELPGGRAEALALPLDGSWSRATGLALWRACTELAFERLQLANLTLERRGLTLCPPRGGAIVRYDGRGLRMAAGAASLDVAGRLGETPIAISSGPIGFAYPGAVSAQQLHVTLGPAHTASRFAIADLSAQIGDDLAGSFGGTDVSLAAVPLDVLGATGTWRYADGRLVLGDGSFRLHDRSVPHRFEPLTARDASLTLADNVIAAEALLREPTTDRAVSTVTLRHDLASGSGHADLAIAGLTFGPGFQPTLLTPNAFGVVANVAGTITGTGRIDWNEREVTSSGRFSSDSLDFAAAFGPVQGASGTIEFTDLLGLTTAPDQRLRVRSINPGIEVIDGEIGIELHRGEVLALTGATWPFMGGTLTMHPVEINIGASEERHYVLEVVGLDAARFVEYMELENMAATGTFDGTVPLVFDALGNGHVVGGLLLSRPPGGNLSYIGQLTYEDMGPIPNFAFNALRSLDYSQMRVTLEGDLTGEIVAQVRMDGVSQGAGAQQNFITRRIAALPIRVDVNVRAPFYSLIGNLRAMYDIHSIRDPRELGLIDAQGNALDPDGPVPPPPGPPGPGDLIPNELPIQRRESEDVP